MYSTKDTRFTVIKEIGNEIESIYRIVDNNCQITEYYKCPRSMDLTEEEALYFHLNKTGHTNEA